MQPTLALRNGACSAPGSPLLPSQPWSRTVVWCCLFFPLKKLVFNRGEKHKTKFIVVILSKCPAQQHEVRSNGVTLTLAIHRPLFIFCKTKTLSPFPLPSLWSPPICVCEPASSGDLFHGARQRLAFGDRRLSLRVMASRPSTVQPVSGPSLYQADGHSTVSSPLLFTRSSINGHLGGFSLLAIVNKVVMNIDVQIALRDPPFNSFG